jgi:hypothetical protein
MDKFLDEQDQIFEAETVKILKLRKPRIIKMNPT